MKDQFSFVALDIETTGFDFIENEIIEIGAVRFDKGKEKDRFSIFIKPQRKVPKFIKRLTNITDEQLASGENLINALTSLIEFIEDDVVVCHNTSFDIGFLNAKLKEKVLPKISNQTLDTLDLARIYLPFILNHKLGTVAEYFKIDLSNAHRAIFDAIATGNILLKLIDFILKNIPMRINHRIFEVSGIQLKLVGLSRFLEKIVSHQKQTALLTKQKSGIDFHNRNYIEHKPGKVGELSIETIFGKDGVFSKHFDKYELREGQIDMASAVLDNFEQKEFLLVEAGTGVGKSLAYLIPSIKYTHQENKKVIISTNTKNLQEQLFYKDLPVVKDCINIPFKATLLKGRGNYICEKRWLETALDLDKMISSEEVNPYLNLIVWKEFTKTGDISENNSFNVNRDRRVWKKVSSDSFLCRKKRCPHYKSCFLMDIRGKAEESNLVIINHHLLLANMQSENAVLGEFDNLIIDEAHNLPHLAPAELGISLSYPDFNNFFNQLHSDYNKFQSGILVRLRTDAVKSDFPSKKELLLRIEETEKLIDDKKDIFAEFFKKVGDVVTEKGSYGKLRITNLENHTFLTEDLEKIIIFWQEFSRSFMKIKNIFGDVNKQRFIEYDKHKESLDSIVNMISEYHNMLSTMHNPELKDYAFWMESFQASDKKYPSGVLVYCPLNVDQIFNDKLYSLVDSAVFTSATIAIRNNFKYFANRMGLNLLEEGFVRELVVQSPFDYQKQTMVLVAGFLPDPKDKFFSSQSIEIIRNAVEITKAGTMVLYTSYKNLNEAYDTLNDEMYSKDILLLTQGKGLGRSAMLKEFQKNRNSVLFGTNSFWEGVDVPGESLQLLILYKLPFMVPSEPIVEAYLEKLEAEGKNSFMHYMLPNALLKYRQGFGRLIRHKTDRGVVLVLDNRILTKRYGQYFKDTVPARTFIPQSDIEVYDHLSKWFKNRR
ncbi:MAG: helicase C-terminal domain-containing protein [Candidatus Tenebribacter mawsonii]|nr:helicase C-terminal domain-containing protein [Candidatus Tenebribacter mawsonii]